MKSEVRSWKPDAGWSAPNRPLSGAQLVLVFGARGWIADPAHLASLRADYPQAHVVGCSTGGQIVEDDVSDTTASALVMAFDHTRVGVRRVPIGGREGSFDAGKALAGALAAPDLKSMFVLSDGLQVNGSQLVNGLQSVCGNSVIITGGLAGDGAAFENTLVTVDGVITRAEAVAVGFYGPSVVVGHGCSGGWDEFGPKRAITRASGNVLYEVDGSHVLDLYKTYLGEEAAGLPGAGLLYPLLISDPASPGRALVRTLLAINEQDGSMTFAGDMPEGWNAQLMRGHFDRLARAAGAAASASLRPAAPPQQETAAVLISCIGRRILMGESAVSEVAAAREALGPTACMTGFYSYGEISPQTVTGFSELHNQTMTITTFSEMA